MKQRTPLESFNYAIQGLIYAIKTQRNMKFHIIIAMAVIIAGIFLDVTKVELIMLSLSITLVLLTEMVNTSIELSTDLIKDTFHPVARVIKDISAGAVLVASINSIVVGYLIFIHRLESQISGGILQLRHSSLYLSFICLVILLILVIITKAIFHKGTPLRGGMPSGHAAVAFSIWAITAFLTSNVTVISLVFIIALLIARNRVKRAVHTVWEVTAGGLLGALVTTIMFKFFG